MPRKSVVPGTVFGRWTVLGDAPDRHKPNGAPTRYIHVRCSCEAATEREVRLADLRNSHTVSCGCFQSESRIKHSMSKTPTYRGWKGMHARCNANTTHPDHRRDYYNRGIRVCARWSGPDGFLNFLSDMGEKPPNKSLDRIDNNGNYERENCRWATPVEQMRNMRNNVWITMADSNRRVLAEACAIAGINAATVSALVRAKHISHQRAFDYHLARVHARFGEPEPA